MLSGLPLAFLIFLFFGMLDFIQHFVLRFFLWRRGRMPWRYDRFLDQAVDLAFLRRVGGGYIFVHRLLQDHFLNLPATEDGSVRWVRRRAS